MRRMNLVDGSALTKHASSQRKEVVKFEGRVQEMGNLEMMIRYIRPEGFAQPRHRAIDFWWIWGARSRLLLDSKGPAASIGS